MKIFSLIKGNFKLPGYLDMRMISAGIVINVELTWYLFKVDNELCVLRVGWGGSAVDEDVLTGPRRTNCG